MVLQYRLLVNRSSIVQWAPAPPRPDCPTDVNWHEVTTGLWPELKATQLMMHSAQCDHCGPLLRMAARMEGAATPEDEKRLSELKAPSRPDANRLPVWRLPLGQLMKWMVPAMALALIAGVLGTRPTPTQLSGPQFAEFAVSTHRQYEQGRLALDIRSDSQQALNEWFQAKSQLSLPLPTSSAEPVEDRPYRLEGAQRMQVGGKTAVFIAYQERASQLQAAPRQTGTVSLLVIPNSVVVASGGIEADFNKIRFHYAMVQPYKVVTWSLHGMTYALVSQEGTGTQRSCMVCHSTMRDRDLSNLPTPLRLERQIPEPVLQ